MSKLQTILNIIFIGTSIVFGGFLLVKGSSPWAQTVTVSAPSVSESIHLTPIMTTAKKTYSIGGLVKTVSGTQVSFVEGDSKTRIANITVTTKIVRVIPVDPQVAAKEAEEVQMYMKNPAAFTPEQVASFKPSLPQEVVVTPADIKAGMHIVVVTEEDSANTDTVNALEIRVQ